MDQRWFAVGHSSREEASEAGREDNQTLVVLAVA
jgi:hypothetical protein